MYLSESFGYAKVDNINKYKPYAYVVGYTFIIDKIPCNITGVVTEKEQNEESIQEIKSLVDEMARTVRNTKDNIMD